MANRLIDETSPYLLQHAHNPVDWYPWGDEAFEQAVREDRPVLLSIGYSACHWCHVMERESFEDDDIARIMNEDFVNIKVDREERPDLDAIHMEAVQAISGSGGWPLTVFLTPQKRPFYGGTYFPPEDRGGMPGFPRVLRTVAEAYRNRKGEVESAADQIIAHLNRAPDTSPSIQPLAADVLTGAYVALKSSVDSNNGGFGSAPKFPQPMSLEFLLRYHHRTGDKEALAIVEHTLQKMASGGMYDQLGGGFHRYSVDARWLVPHFEKMLYDNALLSRVYLHAYQATGNPLHRRIVEETLDYVLREMTDNGGGFYSTQDADSEGIEGKYYAWTLDEIEKTLGRDDGQSVARYFGVTERGNFEGSNILSRPIETDTLASELGLTPDQLDARIRGAKARLLEKRAERVVPHRDEKTLADWNGMMLASLADAALALDREDYLTAAIANATFLTGTMYDGHSLKHSCKNGHVKIDGFLSDYALVSDGLLSLYQATLDSRWLKAARDMSAAMLDRFRDDSRGGFYDTELAPGELIVRPRNVFDNTVPSGSAAAALLLLRLARLTDNAEYERIAAASIRRVQEMMSRYPTGFGHWLCALDLYLSEPVEIAIIGQPGDPAVRSLVRTVGQRYLPNLVVAGGSPDAPGDSEGIPLLEDRPAIDNRATAYLCHNRVCRKPVTEPGELAALLAKSRQGGEADHNGR